MPTTKSPKHPHLISPGDVANLRYISPMNPRTTEFRRPSRPNREAHAKKLLNQLKKAEQAAEARIAAQKELSKVDGLGIYLTFESEPDFELKFDSLEFQPSGIQLCAVKRLSNNRIQATVFVPDGKLKRFIDKISKYEEDVSRSAAKAREQDLIESISDIKLAALEAFWTDDPNLFPDLDADLYWEVWLRLPKKTDALAHLRKHAKKLQLDVGPDAISFLDRTVVLVKGTGRNISRSIDLLGVIAELRAPKTAASFFTEMNSVEQADWVGSFAAQIQPPRPAAPVVTLLDTGLNAQHPLLRPAVSEGGLHTFKKAWGVDDRHGHGTQMAGVALYGDLSDQLGSMQHFRLSHHLESVKVFNDKDPHKKELYGAVTQSSTMMAEAASVSDRVFCMAITADDDRDMGKPSSWSGAIDALTSGMDDEKRRLLTISAGNTDPSQYGNYPDSNQSDPIQDPGQAWNSITVGGYTKKQLPDPVLEQGYSPIAPTGGLSPMSCTSVDWEDRKWPLKPDVVMEAGNLATHPEYAEPSTTDALSVLTTSRHFTLGKMLASFGDTSAASADAARVCAQVWAKYPDLLPESIRALLIHSAEWTPAMLQMFTNDDDKIDYRNLMRCFGYGVPNEGRMLSSLSNSLTLIAQSKLSPFYKSEDPGKSGIKTRDINIHALPWPIEALRELRNTDVSMKVTLSYFIEPSPGERGWTQKFGYASHGLRFRTKYPLEKIEEFRQRINRYEQDETYVNAGYKESGHWRFGGTSTFRTLGSVHSDVWTGPAIDLAERSSIAVHPVKGWWAHRPHLEGWKKTARYSLIITIDTPETDVDIYTPVATIIGTPVVVET